MSQSIQISPLRLLEFTPREASGKPIGGDQRCRECVHLSEIIQPMRIAAGKKVGDIPGEQPWLRAQAGFWLEMALEWAQREYQTAERPQVVRQIHLHLDGIGVTPDGWDPADRVLESDKSTQLTMRKWDEDTANVAQGLPAEHFWEWFMHDMGSIKAFNSFMQAGNPAWQPIYTMRHITYWQMGDYSRRPGRGTQINTCEVTFSPEAIEENWRIVLRGRDYILRKRAENAIPAVPEVPGSEVEGRDPQEGEAEVPGVQGDID